MAINFKKTREIVLFEIDRKSPHDPYRFHRAISRAIAGCEIRDDMFEEVVGCYEGVVSVAYVMDAVAFYVLRDELAYFTAGQLEVYHYSLDAFELVSIGPERGDLVEDWCVGHAFGSVMPTHAPGWTYFPSAGLYFTLLTEETL